MALFHFFQLKFNDTWLLTTTLLKFRLFLENPQHEACEPDDATPSNRWQSYSRGLGQRNYLAYK